MTSDTTPTTPILIYGNLGHLDFVSGLTRTAVHSAPYEGMYAYTTFNNHVYVVQTSGQVDIYNIPTHTLVESFPAPGLEKLDPLLVFPTRLFCLQAGYFLTMEKRVWERVKWMDASNKGYGQSCCLRGCTYVIVSELRPGPPTWCWNCQNEEENFIYQSDLLVLQGESSLLKLPIELPYGLEVPYLLPATDTDIVFIGGGKGRRQEPGIYQFNVETQKLSLLGKMPFCSWATCACIAEDRLYAQYANGSFLNVSLVTGMGFVTNGELMRFLWFISRKLPRMPVPLLRDVIKDYLQISRLRF